MATGVPSPEAAAFLLAHIRTLPESQENLLRYVHHAARHGAKGLGRSSSRWSCAGDRAPANRLALLQAIQQGTQERGEPLDAEVRKLAGELCRKLLARAERRSGWRRDPGRGRFPARRADSRSQGGRQPGRSGRVPPRRGPAGHRGDRSLAGSGAAPRPACRSAAASLDVRESAAISLANLERPEAQAAVLEALPTAPERLQSTIAAALARRREGAHALFKAIEAGKASARLLQERRVVIGLENAEIPRLSERIASLLKGLPPADLKLKELLRERRSGYLQLRPRSGAGRPGLREELRHLPPARGQGGQGGSPA